MMLITGMAQSPFRITFSHQLLSPPRWLLPRSWIFLPGRFLWWDKSDISLGSDVIIAQGGESGGYCGEVSTMALAPQVVDAVAPIPVVASGGIFDGPGIAAALMLGAAGVNLGTRFLASREAPASEEWKQAITKAKSEDSIKVEVLNDIGPLQRRRRMSLRS
jgi:hypothetical protein